MFPSVIPLSGTDCSRVTHPSAARILSSSRNLPTISPLDLHVLSTPPAFVLSQDQTLMFNPLSCLISVSEPARQSQSLILIQQAFHSFESDCFLYSLSLICIVFKDRAAASGSLADSLFSIAKRSPFVNPYFGIFTIHLRFYTYHAFYAAFDWRICA